MLNNETILITGGTGSFGQAFVKHVLNEYTPKSIRIYSRDELKQYEMRMAFHNNERLRFLIGDVRDSPRLSRACEGVDILIHAAALKQVPSCEYNPIEAIKTNIDGAVNVIEAALNSRVKKIIALSTDKAVNPINLYGATKLCSDKVFTQANSYVGTHGSRFSVIRYGNVLASRGSAILLFKQQVLEKKKITITDPRMTRFWITLPKTVSFVISSLEKMRGGEIFVPKLPSMKIVDLAQTIAPECEFEIIGIRPGEKIDEFLISEEEGRHTIELEDRYIVQSSIFFENDPTPEIIGKPVPVGFHYNSRDNTHWLSIQEMRKILKEIT